MGEVEEHMSMGRIGVATEDGAERDPDDDDGEREVEVVLEGPGPRGVAAAVGDHDPEDREHQEEQQGIGGPAGRGGQAQGPDPPGHGVEGSGHPSSVVRAPAAVGGCHGQPVRRRRQAMSPPVAASATTATAPIRKGRGEPSEDRVASAGAASTILGTDGFRPAPAPWRVPVGGRPAARMGAGDVGRFGGAVGTVPPSVLTGCGPVTGTAVDGCRLPPALPPTKGDGAAGGGAADAAASVVAVEDEAGGDAGWVEVVLPDVRTVAPRTAFGDGKAEGGPAPESPEHPGLDAARRRLEAHRPRLAVRPGVVPGIGVPERPVGIGGWGRGAGVVRRVTGDLADEGQSVPGDPVRVELGVHQGLGRRGRQAGVTDAVDVPTPG